MLCPCGTKFFCTKKYFDESAGKVVVEHLARTRADDSYAGTDAEGWTLRDGTWYDAEANHRVEQ
ncbi:hypothetical protein [Nocardia testacea]|uniref:Uncharacterized protein n=1 Tax=Nocardia testacea TaxID=248551 RepID=A0ABW7W6H9_9NOCA